MEQFFSPALIKLFGSVGAVVFSAAWLFSVALVIWLLGTRVFKGSFGCIQSLEVCGLAGMIGVLGGLVTMLLVVITGNMLARPGPALALREFDVNNKLHQALSMLNVMNLWYVAVLGVGLAKLSGASTAKAFVWLLALWIALCAGLIALGWGGQGFA
jgi:hypothetical protein